VTLSIGVDLGQARDYTAIVVSESYRPTAIGPRDWPELRHRLRWIERLRLGLDYHLQAQRIAELAEAAQVQTRDTPSLVVDATGVGRPIVDLLRRVTGLPVRPVIFTAGEDETFSDDGIHRVPKHYLEHAFDLVWQQKRWEAVTDCPNVPILEEEMKAMMRWRTKRGHDTFGARSGQHDDVVMATWLAIWWGERQSAHDAFGEYERRVVQYPGLYGPGRGDQLG